MSRPALPLFLALAALSACSDYHLSDPNGTVSAPGECPQVPADPVPSPASESCAMPTGTFTPIVEWSAGAGENSTALPVVADLDHDGMPEIIGNFVHSLFGGRGQLVVLRGDGSGEEWRVEDANLGYGSAPAVADLDGDGNPEIVTVREYQNSLLHAGDYTVVTYDNHGNEEWESAHFTGDDFDYAAAPVIVDMDGDGSPEIVAGRVILNADGSPRGVGAYGRGSWGIGQAIGMTISEASVPAVADLNLDGVKEVITGDAWYEPDGTALWHDDSQDDGMIAVANLDDDPEGEVVASSYDTVRAIDTDGTVMWGPIHLPQANIVSPPAIGDLDGDGKPEIVVAGGNVIYALHSDGSILWQADAHDMSGATGASIFDFEGDGKPEVVYIDEIEMIAFDGVTGAVKFYSDEHASNTMMDYPVIADVDNDGHAEIVVAHAGYGVALSVYGDQDNSWAPARKVWNQHAYSITNIHDDLSVPTDPTPGWESFNSYHSAIDRAPGQALDDDLAVEILDACTVTCTSGSVYVSVRVYDQSVDHDVPAGVPVSLYADSANGSRLVDTITTPDTISAGWSGTPLTFQVPADLLDASTTLRAVVDDDGTGAGIVPECVESNNTAELPGVTCQ